MNVRRDRSMSVVMQPMCAAVLVAVLGALPSFAGFRDESPMDASSRVIAVSDGSRIRIDWLSDRILRVRRTSTDLWPESALNRYGLIAREIAKVDKLLIDLAVDDEDGTIELKSHEQSLTLDIRASIVGKGYSLEFALEPDERIFGLGDCSRESVQRRPGRYDMWVRNHLGIPIPVFYSSRGWGVFNNSTWRHSCDIGKTRPDRLSVEASEGEVDFYVFIGRDFRELISAYVELTGKPKLLPVWGYGLSYVANSEINDFELCREARDFRREGVPCDVIGLEPGWMSRDYDMSTTKFWDRRKFHIPYWSDEQSLTFIGALSRMGFKLSLWTCCDYDLTRYEEECVCGAPDAWKQTRLRQPKSHVKDAYRWWEFKFENEPDEACFPEGAQPWFEHYKKFVREGVRAFKLDGCNQYGEHPDRKWANGKSDREVHNLYPVIYAKQMTQGFETFAKRRSMINSAGGYAGVQRFVATWAGDTGGGLPALMSAQCLGFCGHANTSCDLECSPEGMHYGFLQAWTFHDNWDYFQQPWYLTQKAYARFRHYAQLRYRLLPYIYTAAAEASRTGWPIVRALSLVYPDHPEYDGVRGTYLLGDSLLVSAFEEEAVIPQGTWYDWRTGERVRGPCRKKVVKDGLWGGALYARAGAVVPTWEGRQFLEKGWNEKVTLLVWPHENDGETQYELYEDEGNDLGYQEGQFALTPIVLRTTNGHVDVRIGKRNGNFPGMGNVVFSVCQNHHDEER